MIRCVAFFIRSAAMLIFLGLPMACAQAPERRLQAHVLMPLAEFIEKNHDAVQEQLPSLDPRASLLSVGLTDPVAFDYRDPENRFELSYPAVGSPANTTQFMISRGTRRGGQTLAIKHMEFALSDGAPLAKRIDEATELYAYLQQRGFRPVGYATFQEEVAGATLTDFRELNQYIDKVEVPRIGGMHLFTIQRDELMFDVSLIHQLYTSSDSDFTLYLIIREKVLGVE